MKYRPRFSLKQILFAVTLLCVWLGWNAYHVHRRIELRKLLQSTSCTIVELCEIDEWKVSGDESHFSPDSVELLSRKTFDGSLFLPTQRSGEISFIRRLMGDEPVFAIWVGRETDTRIYREAFPEARVLAASRGEGEGEGGSNSK